MSDLNNPYKSSPSPNSPFGAPSAPTPGTQNYNPYAAPKADLGYGATAIPGEDFQMLASRGNRFLGSLLDGFVAIVFMVPPFFMFGGLEDETAIIAAVVGLLLIMSVQWYLVATSGQSIAKRLIGMKIVKLDGSDVNFVSGVIMRTWVIQAMGAVPFVGNFVGLVDAVMIFREDHRCLHDHIAGTKVISV